MSRLARARIATGALALILLTAMTWIGFSRIAPVAPGGVLLQSQVFGYDTATLWAFVYGVRGAAEEPIYRFTLLVLDTAFIMAFAAFTVLVLWPRRLLGGVLAALYAGTDLMENQRLLATFDEASPLVLNLPEPGTLAVAGYLTAQKFLLIALIAGSIVVTQVRERNR